MGAPGTHARFLLECRAPERRARREKSLPHVVIEGPVDLEEVGRRFRPLFHRDGNDILKVERLYLDSEGAEALLDTLVVEAGHRQHFFLQVRLRDGGGATVRLLPLTDPEKTDGVKRAVARVATWVRGIRPGEWSYGSTNIGEYLDEPPPA